MDFSDKYGLLFGSIVFLCSIYALFLAFYVNDQIRNIHQPYKSKKLKNKPSPEVTEQKLLLVKKSKRIMRFLLMADLAINSAVIIIKGYYDVYGIIGGMLLPVFWYFVFVFFLHVAVGLNGQKILHTGKFFRGLD